MIVLSQKVDLLNIYNMISAMDPFPKQAELLDDLRALGGAATTQIVTAILRGYNLAYITNVPDCTQCQKQTAVVKLSADTYMDEYDKENKTYGYYCKECLEKALKHL